MAGAGQNSSDSNFLNWALALIRQLLFPGKRSKEVIETGEDDSIDTDPGAGGSKDEGDVKADMSTMFDHVENGESYNILKRHLSALYSIF